MNFGENILKYKDDILRDLAKLVSIRSVYSESPENCLEALKFMLRRAEQLGLKTKNVENKAGHIELGGGGKLCGVLTHLDVVPAGNGWSFEPFALTRTNGRLYGRGVDDDKGASVINLYCLKALLDAEVVGKNTLRVIYGTDEEVGMSDMEVYFGEEPLPFIGFTPDSDYGLCYAEKGIFQIRILSKKNSELEFTSGSAVNAVPDEAKAVYGTSDGVTAVSVQGKASHACEPENGENAAVKMVEHLYNNGAELGNLLAFVREKIGAETDGKSLGIKMKDEPSGELSCCLSTVRINDKENFLTLDIRYPVTKDVEEIKKNLLKALEEYDLILEVIHHAEPLYLPENSPAIRLLSGAYEDVLGEKPELYSTGGGTYARMMGGRGVAFGPAFHEDKVNMHNADESLDEENFWKHAQICLQAMYKMYVTDFEESYGD